MTMNKSKAADKASYLVHGQLRDTRHQPTSHFLDARLELIHCLGYIQSLLAPLHRLEAQAL
jgi:hypothetical protein